MYKLKKPDIPEASKVLARAFMNDPIWTTFMPDKDQRAEVLPLMFESLLYISLKYGTAQSPTEPREGIAIWYPSKNTDANFFQVIFSGIPFSCIKAMNKHGKVMKKMQKEMKILSRDRKKHMQKRDHLYLACIGVDPQLQGKGHGGTLLQELFRESVEKNVPVYLETETEENVKMYSHLGFKVVVERILEGSGIHLWQMVRDV